MAFTQYKLFFSKRIDSSAFSKAQDCNLSIVYFLKSFIKTLFADQRFSNAVKSSFGVEFVSLN